MKTVLRKFLAVCMIFAVVSSVFAFTSSAAGISEGQTRDIYMFGSMGKSMYFTPERTGYYNIKSYLPQNFIGKIINRFFETDPFVSIINKEGERIGYLDDYYSEDNNTSLTVYDYANFKKLDPYFDGYVYLNAGETYKLRFADEKHNRFFKLGAYCVNISFASEGASVKFTCPKKVKYSISAGETNVHEYEDGNLYNARVDFSQFKFRAALSDGTPVSLRNAADYGEIIYNVFSEEDLGKNGVGYICYIGFGQSVKYDFTVVA